ncbi:unnamed protein product [Paramecium octaurelia]|uniref:Tetratricopeptide repeat protein n=1 Tax=Paramecium octaurelia TaxID=43137 RepID=A0A8S1YNN0_PAROT|nr:unnamed protein product [Paramecium octaurelia]
MSVIRVKCQKEQHEFVELACLNKQCKANRIYCHQCLKNGDHVAHPKDQKNLIELIDYFHNLGKESEKLIQNLCLMVEQLKDLMFQLNQELRTKYQFSKERLQSLNTKQLNQALDQIIQYDDIQIIIKNQLQICSDNMIKQIQIQMNELKLDQVKIYQLNQQDQQKVKELYQQAYNLYYDDKYEEAIKILDAALQIDQNHLDSLYLKAKCLTWLSNYKDAIIWTDKALLINSNHLDSLSTKAQCLRWLSNYKDAIIWADKALLINSNHLDSLSTKANCLRWLSNYKDAIIWADKALMINSNHFNSLSTKGDSLLQLGEYEEALKIIDQALNQSPNSPYTLYLGGECLKSLQRFEEAIVYYDKAHQIDQNQTLYKNAKAECEKKIDNYKCVQ